MCNRLCNRYASDIRKAGLEKDDYGFSAMPAEFNVGSARKISSAISDQLSQVRSGFEGWTVIGPQPFDWDL